MIGSRKIYLPSDMGEKRETKSNSDEGSADQWSLSAERLREILRGDEEARRSGYADMIDRYHDIFDFLKEMEKEGLPGRIEVDRMRDRLHKQLLEVGQTLGKDAADVQADLLRREGNLAEYGLPEYGLIAHEDISADPYDAWSFGGLEIDKRRGAFSRQMSAKELLKQQKEWARLRTRARGEADEGDGAFREQYREKTIDVPDVGTVKITSRLKPGEVVVIFGLMFTVDIQQESCPITPADYTERLRRAARAAAAYGGTLFKHTIGAYHDTTTLIGVAIPSERLEEVSRLLRENQATFGVRKRDLDPRVVEADRRKEIEHIRTTLATPIERATDAAAERMQDLKAARGIREIRDDDWKEEVDEEREKEEYKRFFETYLKKRKQFFGEDPEQYYKERD